MIRSDGRGILNDWDHAGKKDELTHGIVSQDIVDLRNIR